jgi:hypothetical protein
LVADDPEGIAEIESGERLDPGRVRKPGGWRLALSELDPTLLRTLLEAEVSERAERRERRRLIEARFPALKRFEDFCFTGNPGVPQATSAASATTAAGGGSVVG